MCIRDSSYTGTTFASTKDNLDFNLNEKIQKEIQLEKQEVFQIVYEQLKEQDALSHMNIYKDILGAEIESTVYSQYVSKENNRAATSSTRYNFTYGGSMAYNRTEGSVASTYLDYDNSYYYVLGSGSCVARTIIEAILGALPNWGYAFTPFHRISGQQPFDTASVFQHTVFLSP